MKTSKKDIINTLYISTLLATPTIAYSYALKRFFRINIGSPSSATLNEVLKLGGVVAVGNMSLDYLYQQGIIPENIMK